MRQSVGVGVVRKKEDGVRMSKSGDYEDKAFLAELYDLVPRYSGRRALDFYVDLC